MNDVNTAADAVAALDVSGALADADALAGAFEQAGDRIARSLEGAARRGELSFNGMAEAVLKDLARLAVSELVEAPLQSLIGGLTGALGKAVGGGGQNIVMNITGAADAGSFQRSEGQIAASLARATRLGAGRVG